MSLIAKNNKNIRSRFRTQIILEGDDNMTDWYEITERIKKFNDILNEVGGSL
jgi:hypothetical protein